MNNKARAVILTFLYLETNFITQV